MPRGLAWPLAALLAALPLAATFADGGPTVPVRVGIHEGYSRVAFNLPSRTDYHVTQQGQHVVVQFAGNVTIGAANAVPRNVLSITGGAGQAEIVVAAGTTVRDWRLGNLVVIDVMDGTTRPRGRRRPLNRSPPNHHRRANRRSTLAQPAASPTPTAAAPPAGAATAGTGRPSQPPSQPKAEATNPQPEPVQAAAPAQPAPPDPAQASIAQPAPAAGAADTAAQTASGVEPGIVVPGGPQFGVAAFRRGNTALIVFDQPRTIDLSRAARRSAVRRRHGADAANGDGDPRCRSTRRWRCRRRAPRTHGASRPYRSSRHCGRSRPMSRTTGSFCRPPSRAPW